MNHLIKRALQAGILVGGLWVIGQGIASADTVQAPASAPATVCGNSIGLLSDPSAGCPASSTGTTSTSSDGSTVNAPASTPVNVTGNSVVIGQPTGTGSGSGTTSTGTGTTGSGSSTSGSTSGGSSTGGTGLLGTGLLAGGGLAGSDALGSDNVNAPVTSPAVVCGNTVGVGSSPSSGCPAGTASSTSGTGAGQSSGTDGTNGTNGTNGTTATAPVTAPATVCGNGVGILGGGGASCGQTESATVTNPNGPTPPAPLLPTLPTSPVTGPTSANPVATLFADTAQSLASTGADIQSVLAIAMGLLYTGVTMALATVKRTVSQASDLSSLGSTDTVPALS